MGELERILKAKGIFCTRNLEISGLRKGTTILATSITLQIG